MFHRHFPLFFFLLLFFFDDSLYIFGGRQPRGLNGTLYRFSLHNRVWLAVPLLSSYLPPPRYFHSAVLHHHKWIIFGGLIPQNTNSLSIFTFNPLTTLSSSSQLSPQLRIFSTTMKELLV